MKIKELIAQLQTLEPELEFEDYFFNRFWEHICDVLGENEE